MADTRGQEIYEFGGFRLERRRRRLAGPDGGTIALRARVFDTLLYLIGRAGELVPKSDLLEAVWPNVVVDENNLNQAISTLRQVLGDDRQSPRFIATVPGRGYQFVAEVTRSGAATGQLHDTGSKATDRASGARRRAFAFGAIAIAAVLALAGWLLARAPGGESGPGMLVDQQLVSTFPGSHRSPALSPDGTMVAFVSDASGTDQVWIASLAGGEPIRITGGPVAAERPAWSPRNDRIVFARADGGIWSVGTLGSPAPRRVVEHGHNPRLSRDGETLVYERGREIWLANADGGNQRRVDGVPTRAMLSIDAWPSLSPDGRHIAFFLSEAAIAGDIWTIPVEGGEARRLTFDTAASSAPVWAPDGRHLVYASRREGTLTLWRVGVDGHGPEPVTSGVGEDSEPAFAGDGQRLLYANTRTTWRLMSTDAASARHEVLYESRYPIRLPDASPGGHSIAFFSDQRAGTHIFVIGSNGSDLRQLTFGKGERNTLPYWSADGQSVYFFRGTPAYSLHRIAVDEGGQSAEVIPGFHWSRGRTWPAERPGGGAIAFVDWGFPEFDGSRTVIRSLAAGAETTLAEPAVRAPAWSADGSRIIGDQGGFLVTCDVGTSACTGLAGENVNLPGHNPRWSADRSDIFFLRRAREPQMHEVWAVGRDGGEPRRLFEIGPIAPSDIQFAVTGGDRVVWVQRAREESEIWMARIAGAPDG